MAIFQPNLHSYLSLACLIATLGCYKTFFHLKFWQFARLAWLAWLIIIGAKTPRLWFGIQRLGKLRRYLHLFVLFSLLDWAELGGCWPLTVPLLAAFVWICQEDFSLMIQHSLKPKIYKLVLKQSRTLARDFILVLLSVLDWHWPSLDEKSITGRKPSSRRLVMMMSSF